MKWIILLIGMAGLAQNVSAQAENPVAVAVEVCANAATTSGEVEACAGIGAALCREALEDPDEDYVRIRCQMEELGVWTALVNDQAERSYRKARAFEDQLYEQDNAISPDYLRFAENTIEGQNAWQTYTRSQCKNGSFADQLQRIGSEDQAFCLVPRFAQRFFELRELQTHFDWRE